MPHIDPIRDIMDMDLSIELLGLSESGVLLVHYHVFGAGYVLLVETLDVADDIVTRFALLSTLVVHLHGEDLGGARIGDGVSWQEDDLLIWLHETMFDAACKDITDILAPMACLVSMRTPVWMVMCVLHTQAVTTVKWQQTVRPSSSCLPAKIKRC